MAMMLTSGGVQWVVRRVAPVGAGARVKDADQLLGKCGIITYLNYDNIYNYNT